MKFPHNPKFNSEFDRIPGLKWYPYVGEHFSEKSQRVMVFAHNIPIKPEEYEAKNAEWQPKETWADCIEEYAYEQGWWTEAFRYFVKGAVGLSENYTRKSSPEMIAKVDDFLSGISYVNFIQGLVKSDSQIAQADAAMITESKRINKEILGILGNTHCICWGAPVFDYVKDIPGWTAENETSFDQKGFGYCLVRTDSATPMHVLKIHHPSMPNFRPYSTETQKIISDFLLK